MTIALTDRVRMNFVRIPAGRFIMGSSDGELDEQPRSVVTIAKPFWMGATEVSNQQYHVFDESHDSGYLDAWWVNQARRGYDVRQPESPVIRVSAERALEFCMWLSQKTGERVTLPTEAQWEWACRAGNGDAMHYGGRTADFSTFENLADVTTKQLVRTGIANTPHENPTPIEAYLPAVYTSDDGALVATRCASYQPNAWGLYDMHGNVQEWTRSDYRPYPYSDSNGRSAPNATERKVVRGGSWRDRPKRATSSYRRDYPAWQQVFNVGFRVIIEE
jgi:formylglycine-generating enzyme required for sulfatase activity